MELDPTVLGHQAKVRNFALIIYKNGPRKTREVSIQLDIDEKANSTLYILTIMNNKYRN